MSQSPEATDGLPSRALLRCDCELPARDGAVYPSGQLLRLLPRQRDSRTFLRWLGTKATIFSSLSPPSLPLSPSLPFFLSLLEMRTDLTLAVTKTWFKCYGGAELAQASRR